MKQPNQLADSAGSRERLGYIDAAKGLGILLIMYGHVTDLSNPVDTWMSSFKVVIFYIITGMLYAYAGTPHKRSIGVFNRHVLVIPCSFGLNRAHGRCLDTRLVDLNT